MKKIIYISIITLFIFTFATAEEKKKCSEFKKLSKEHLVCKAKQVKESVKNFSITDEIKVDGKSVNEIIKKK